MDTELDYAKLKYVLYARKSTVDKERQVRSIPDQIKDCQLMAEQLGLRVVKVLRETKSAKRPNQRPVYREMIENVKRGKYDGILAWNPDRLARNMLEGGEIINLVDDEILKDLKFKTHFFTKDANGKMLLGMAFVLSKQYSDDLSQKVSRGVRNRLEEGRTAIPKHGYLNDRGLYQPDGDNYKLICQAWKMRVEGTSIEEIVKYINQCGYKRTLKKEGGKTIKMSLNILSKVFKDPFYYGILIQTTQKVDLREFYDFQPAITEEEYMAVQELSRRKINPYKIKAKNYYPFRQMIDCSYCGKHMVVAASKSESVGKYLYYRCDTEDCVRPKKSIRAKEILNFIYDFLEKDLHFTEEDYQQYYKGITSLSKVRHITLQTDLHRKSGLLKHTKAKSKEISLKLVEYGKTQKTIREANEQRIAELDAESTELEKEIATIQEQLRDPEKDQLSVEQFLNLSKNAATVVKSADPIIKDKICRLIFLNLTVDEQKVTAYQLKEPFATLVKQRVLSSSRGGENRTLYLPVPNRACHRCTTPRQHYTYFTLFSACYI